MQGTNAGRPWSSLGSQTVCELSVRSSLHRAQMLYHATGETMYRHDPDTPPPSLGPGWTGAKRNIGPWSDESKSEIRKRDKDNCWATEILYSKDGDNVSLSKLRQLVSSLPETVVVKRRGHVFRKMQCVWVLFLLNWIWVWRSVFIYILHTGSHLFFLVTTRL